jgi:hypothetical protein
MTILSSFTGGAEVHYVASRLNALGYHVALTVGNVPAVDLLVSSSDGASSISIQVKTSRWALRMRGRGVTKKAHHYEWDIGWNCARLDRGDLVFALVDLKDFDGLPDVFLIPSKVIATYFAAGPEGWPRARYHPLVGEIKKFKNDWNMLSKCLK